MNKFLILIAAFLLSYQFSNAQTDKGTQTLGLDLGYNYSNDNDVIVNPDVNSASTVNTRTTGFNIGPNYSYFIADKLDIGAVLSYSSSSTSYYTANTANEIYPLKDFSHDYGGNLFIRKYLMYKDKIGLRPGAYIGYQHGNDQNTYAATSGVPDYISKSDYYFAGASLDIVYYPSKKLGFSARIANLEYEHYKFNNGSQGNESGDSLNLNYISNGLYLSVFYLFGAE
jgi:hypothetical protein